MSLLERLPNELFANVAGSLDCATICSLRLVNREISAKTNQDVILAPHFRVARVNLTVESLTSFKSATSGIVGRYVEDLTLIGLGYDYHTLAQILADGGRKLWHPGQVHSRLVEYTEEQLSRVQRDHDTLRQKYEDYYGSRKDGKLLSRCLVDTFINISAKSMQRCLKNLTIEIRAIVNPDEGSILVRDSSDDSSWRSQLLSVITTTLGNAFYALNASELKDVRELHILTSTPASLCCGLPVDVMFITLDEKFMTNLEPFPSKWLFHVRRLSISFTDPVFLRGANHRLDLQTRLQGNDSLFGLTGLLRVCSNVEELHLGRSSAAWHWNAPYDVQRHCKWSVFALQIQHLTQHVRLPRLRKLRLGGFAVQAASLANLLTAFSGAIKNIELVALNVSGDLSKALAPLTTPAFHTLESIAMEAIYVHGRLIEGNRAHDQAYPTITGGGASRWTVIRRVGQAAREPIDYSFAQAGTPWTFQEGMYEQAIKDEYQWPGSG